MLSSQKCMLPDSDIFVETKLCPFTERVDTVSYRVVSYLPTVLYCIVLYCPLTQYIRYSTVAVPSTVDLFYGVHTGDSNAFLNSNGRCECYKHDKPTLTTKAMSLTSLKEAMSRLIYKSVDIGQTVLLDRLRLTITILFISI